MNPKKFPSTTARCSTKDDVCPVCHGSGWELYTVSPQAVEDVYGIDNKGCQEFARKCTRCFGITKDTYDATCVPDTYRDCDIGKFEVGIYKKPPEDISKIINSFVYDFKNGQGRTWAFTFGARQPEVEKPSWPVAWESQR